MDSFLAPFTMLFFQCQNVLLKNHVKPKVRLWVSKIGHFRQHRYVSTYMVFEENRKVGTLYHEKQCMQVPPASIFGGRTSAAEIVCNSLVERSLRDVERRREKEYVLHFLAIARGRPFLEQFVTRSN